MQKEFVERWQTWWHSKRMGAKTSSLWELKKLAEACEELRLCNGEFNNT